MLRPLPSHQPRSQSHQHSRSSAPDIALAVGYVVNIDRQLANLTLARFVIGGIQYVVERHLEHVMYFRGGDVELIARIDKAYPRWHAKPRKHPVIRQIAGKLHQLGT